MWASHVTHRGGGEVWQQEDRLSTLCGPPCYVRLEFVNHRVALFDGRMPASGIHHRWEAVIVWLQFEFGFLSHFLRESGRWR